MKYFKKEEFSDYSKMDKGLLKKLDLIRRDYGQPIHINSSYRSPEHKLEVNKTTPGEHTQGRAVDIHCGGSRERALLMTIAIANGINRIGIGHNFLHLGVSSIRDQNVFWLY